MKFIGRGFLLLLFLFIALCTTNEIRERILVHRAGALLKDMHALHLRQSNWNDAQTLMTRWGRWGHYDGACSSEDCMYVITLHDRTVPTGNLAEWTSRTAYLLSAFRLLPRQWGAGLRVLQTMFLVHDGLIVRSGIQIDMTQSPYAKGAQPVCCGAELIMSVRSQASLGLPEGWEERGRRNHPNYKLWKPGGCTFCLMGRVTYADSMSPEEAATLSDFQLSCATRWSSCLTLEELNPAAHAWHLYESPWGDPPDSTPPQPMPIGCTAPLYALGRDANRIVLVEAVDDGINMPKNPDDAEQISSQVRVVATVKGVSPWKTGSIQKVVSSGSRFEDNFRLPVPFVKAHHYLLFLDKDDMLLPKDNRRHPDDALFGNCGIIAEDAASESEVKRGILMDDQLDGFEPSISLEGFERHQPRAWDH